MVLTPALVIDRARLEANISRMAAALPASVALRPHFKTSKLIEVARLQLAAGAIGFTVSTPEEADALLTAGITDLFWAHAPVGAKAALAAGFNTRGTVAVGLDSAALALPLSAEAVARAVTVPVLIEVDTGLGRTGVAPDDAVELARTIDGLPGIELRGVYMHEGQVAGVSGGRDAIRAAGAAAARQLVEVADAIRGAGIRVPVVSVGSTPAWDSSPWVEGVTEARAGTYVFNDANQLRLGSNTLDQCALTVLATVVSVRDGFVIVDAGTKAMSSDRANSGSTYGLVLAGDGLAPDALAGVAPDALAGGGVTGDALAGGEFSAAWEEHGRIDGLTGLSVGDTVRILPNHACGTVNMWSSVHVGDEVWRVQARH